MRLIAIAAFAGLFATATHADTMGHCAAAWKAKTPVATAVGSYKAWSKTCLAKDYMVPTEAGTMNAVPAGATAQCKDGTYSTAKTASGRCSSHGGVAKTL
jgi:hypothetical protein